MGNRHIATGLNHLHRLLARSDSVVRGAVKLRNQLNAIVAYSRAQSPDSAVNGEHWLLSVVASDCRFAIDVGANVGSWVEPALGLVPPNARVLCFEPSPSAYARLVAAVGTDSRVEVIPAAAGPSEGLTEFFDPGDCSVIASTIMTPELKASERRLIPMVTLDAELARRDWAGADFLKIDAEGYDFEVLRGCTGLLRAQRIGVIQFEYNGAWRFAGSTLARTLDFLSSFGYSTFLLQPRSLRRVEYERFGEYFAFSIFVALAPERLSQFEGVIEM